MSQNVEMTKINVNRFYLELNTAKNKNKIYSKIKYIVRLTSIQLFLYTILAVDFLIPDKVRLVAVVRREVSQVCEFVASFPLSVDQRPPDR